MARLNVNPTRMVLTSLKKRLKTAMRGHKLMKDKRDELIKRFIVLAKENKELRDYVENRIEDIYLAFTMANAEMSDEIFEEALMYPKHGVEVNVKYERVLSVEIPVPEFIYKSEDNSEIYPYGFADTSGELDGALRHLAELFPAILELAALEKKLSLLAGEIEWTRRRVNALEYIMIPKLQETIKYIRMKLDENERGTLARLMKVKDMMIEEAIIEKRSASDDALQEYEANRL